MGWAYSGLESRLCNGDSCLWDPCSIICLIDLKDVGAQGQGTACGRGHFHSKGT